MSKIVDQITAAYQQDQTRGFRPVRSINDLPNSYEEITDEWLTEALCAKAPGAAVVGHKFGPADDGSSNRRRLEIDYNAAGKAANLPERLFCKASHGLANRIVLGVAGGAFCEADFYNDIRPHLVIEAPIGFFAKVDAQSFNSIVMLGDITDTVTEFCNHKTVMTRARVESQLRQLAEMHGKGYSHAAVREQMQKFATWPEYFEKTLNFGMKEGSEQGFLRSKEVAPPALYKRHTEIWPATMASMETHRKLPHTFAHGDVHLKNWYVAGNGEMGLGDWQCAHRGHWGRDFGYTIATALTVEDRRRWEKDLLRYYLDRMHAAGGPSVPFEAAWLHYRQQLVTALTWWTITLNPAPGMPDMQPLDVTLEFVRRLTTAMDDVGTLDSYR